MGGRPLANTAASAAGVTHLRALGTKVTLAVDRDDDLRVAEAVLRHRTRRGRPCLQPLSIRLRDPKPERHGWSSGAGERAVV